MSKRIDGTSLFTSMNSGLSNTFSVLSTTFNDGITLKNLATNEATSALTSNGLGQNFKSYIQTNFSTMDKNHDGTLSPDELNTYTQNLTMQGMTMEQLAQLGTSTGMSSSLLDTVMSHFNEIDKNKDGKVTNDEIQAFGVDSSVEKQRISDRNNMLKIKEILNDLPPYVKDYFTSRKNDTTTRTRLSYAYDLRRFFEWLKGAVPNLLDKSLKDISVEIIGSVTARDIEEYTDFLQYDKDNMNHRSGIARKLSALSSFFDYLYRNHFLHKHFHNHLFDLGVF